MSAVQASAVPLREPLVADMGLHNTNVLVGKFPDQTGPQINSRQLALIHTDVDVHDSALRSFDWAWHRLSPGGVVVLDDCGCHGCEGETRMVNSIQYSDALLIYNVNGHGLAVKIAA